MPLRVPLIFNLRRDPYERAEITSNTYYDWLLDRAYLLVPAQAYVGKFLATFQEFPPRQKAASFSLDQVMEKLAPAGRLIEFHELTTPASITGAPLGARCSWPDSMSVTGIL